jgi:ketosteroid isomerase-like protein
MNRLCIFLTFLITTVAQSAATQDECKSECQLKLITAYYADIEKIIMAGSNLADIDNFLDSMHDDVHYIHVEYEAKFDKPTWKKAFIRRLEAGSYNGSNNTPTTINHVIHGYNYAAVEFISRYHDEATNKVITSSPRLAMFGFADGKISYIRDYWYHLAED